MSKQTYLLHNITAEQLRDMLEQAASRAQVRLVFLMRRWNGRFATYNLATPITKSPADARESDRGYRVIGRVKFNTQPDGRIMLVISPPALCDPNPTSNDRTTAPATADCRCWSHCGWQNRHGYCAGTSLRRGNCLRRAVLEGYRIPRVPPNPDFRRAMEALAAREGAQALYNRLQTLDPEAAANIAPRNVRRIIRALEVIEATGEPFSAQQGREPPPYDILRIGLTMPREALYARADARIRAMWEAGWADEVRRLLAEGYTPETSDAMKSLGYPEVVAYDRVPVCGAGRECRVSGSDVVPRDAPRHVQAVGRVKVGY